MTASSVMPSFAEVYAFLRDEYLHSRFEGKNQEWPRGVPEGGTYAELVTRGYIETLAADGEALIPPTESRRAKAVRFDRSLTITNPDAPPVELPKFRAGSLTAPMAGDWA